MSENATTVRREKPYTCMDVDLPRNPRLHACKDPAGCLGLWNALVAYAREQLTDGFVPKSYALALWGDRKNNARLIDMIANGLLADRGNEIEVLKYSPRNQTKAAVEDAKRSARERMAAKRAAAKKACSSDVRPNNPRTNEEHPPDVPTSTSTSISKDLKQAKDPEGIVVPAGEGDARPSGGKLPDHIVNFERNDWIAAYERAVDAAKGGDPWSFPTKAFSALRAVVEKQCRGADRRNIGAWIERDVVDFVRAILDSDDKDPKFFSQFGPDGLLKWHNEDRPGLRRTQLRAVERAEDIDEPLPPRPMSREENERAAEEALAGIGGARV